jgi:NDP-mannose synthase
VGSTGASEGEGGVKAVILAGGRGRRLEPYSTVLPKPLMPLGQRPILEVTIDRLVASGIRDITLCVGYLAHLIVAVLNGRDHGARVTYVHEEEPLGTAGPLRLVPELNGTFLVMNGDLLTDLDFTDVIRAHRTARNTITIAAHRRSQTIDYGILHSDEREPDRLVRFEEKPRLALDVSMGVYVMEPAVLQHIPEEGYFDFPQLVDRLLERDVRVGIFPFTGAWLDIGRPEDYAQARELWTATEHET